MQIEHQQDLEKFYVRGGKEGQDMKIRKAAEAREGIEDQLNASFREARKVARSRSRTNSNLGRPGSGMSLTSQNLSFYADGR